MVHLLIQTESKYSVYQQLQLAIPWSNNRATPTSRYLLAHSLSSAFSAARIPSTLSLLKHLEEMVAMR